MPRVSRFAVEFTIPSQPDKVWLAEFSHKHGRETCPHLNSRGNPEHIEMVCSHYDEKGRALHPRVEDCPLVRLRMNCDDPQSSGIPYTLPDGKILMVKHVTHVKLRHKGTSIFLPGSSPCSLRDEYNWRQGLHLAMQRAMEKGKFCALTKANGHIVVSDKTIEYDEICEAFWREMHLLPATNLGGSSAPEQDAFPAGGGNDAGQHITVEPAVLQARPSHGMGAVEYDFPQQFQHGTYHMGAD